MGIGGGSGGGIHEDKPRANAASTTDRTNNFIPSPPSHSGRVARPRVDGQKAGQLGVA
jgi:hypothetical protein